VTSTRARRIRWLVAAIGISGLFTPHFAEPQARAADRLWDNPDGGFFSEPLNWFGGMPATNDVARFETTDSSFFQRTYTVDFTANISNQRMVVEDDGVTFNLKGHTYQLTDSIEAILLGTVPNRSGNLTVKAGALSMLDSADINIASVAGGSGALTVGAGGSVLRGHFDGGPGVRVGVNGNGTLDIISGGFVRADRMTIGVNRGSTGTVAVTGNGSLRIINDLNFGDAGSGTLRVKNGGKVVVDGRMNFIGGIGTLDLELGRFADATQIQVGRQIVLGGNLQFSLESGFIPDSQAEFRIITANLGIVGSFANVANGQRLTTSDGLGSFVVNYGPGNPEPNHVVLSAFLAGVQDVQGDFDHDGKVDGNDFLVWQRGGSPTPLSAIDLAAWRTEFGRSGADATSSAVPEPSGGALLLCGLLSLLVRTRKGVLRAGMIVTSTGAGRIRWLVAAICLSTPQFAAQQSGAADKLWDNVNGGVFTLASNWFGGVPGLNDVARFETTNSNSFQRTYTVSFANDPTNQQLVVEDDNVTLNLIGSSSNHTYTFTNPFVAVALGTVAGRSGNLTVRNGTLSLPSQSDIEIAPVANASGALTVGAGGGVIGAPDVLVGLNGDGRLDINSGGDVIANAVRIGVNSSLTGTATVSGNGSSLFPAEVTIGDQGNGVLNVTNGGHIESRTGVIGNRTDSRGVVNIDGNGSTWDVSTLLLGSNVLDIFGFFAGRGTLNITGGGQVAADRVVIGFGAGSTGQVNVASTIPGATSILAIDGDLGLGYDSSLFGPTGGSGTLLIQAGGTVSVTGLTFVGTTTSLLRLEGGTFNASVIAFSAGDTGRFSWTAGTLRVGRYVGSLTVPNGGVLAPVRSVDGTTITGSYNQQAAGATLAVEIGGPFAFTDYSVLTVKGAATLGGNLQLTLTDGFVPTAINSFDILRADGGLTGAFANVANGQRLFTTDGHGSFIVNYGPGSLNPSHVVLSQFLPGLPGDFDVDGDVDGTDFLLWQRGDSSNNGSAADLVAWRVNFGLSSLAAAGRPTPEPRSAIACVTAFLVCGHIRRR
jgi:T5SS/PEP-CTERM-associated repeat protein